jgi:hypothetical protein
VNTEKIRLGKTGLLVSRVGMGSIPLTRPPEHEAINTRRAHSRCAILTRLMWAMVARVVLLLEICDERRGKC